MRGLPKHRGLLLLICTLYLGLGLLYALRTPAWQTPDEPAHYNYVAQIERAGCCPVIEMGDWDSAYLDTLKANEFAAELLTDLAAVQYEDHQPPLYYLLLTPVFVLTNGSLTALRLVSIIIGLGTVICAYASARLLVPARPQVALMAAAVVAFLPQYLAIAASVNNDGLSWTLIGLIIAFTLQYLGVRDKPDVRGAAGLGLLVGIALLTKLNTIFLVGLVPIAILLRGWQQKPTPVRSLMAMLTAFVLPALALPTIWWLRNLAVYGFPDLFGLAAHDRIVIGQLRTEELIAQIGADAYLRRALETTFNSFFGQLGWLALPLPGWAYVGIALLIAAALIGWIIVWMRPLDTPQQSDPTRLQWLWLGLVGVLAVAQYVYYNGEFVQFQGRYMFTGLIPFALLLAGGWSGWLRLFHRQSADTSTAWPSYAILLLPLLLVPLNVWLLWRVVPGLAPGV